MNFYPFHVGDYTLRTAHLEPMEDLAYRRLLDLYYVNESPLQGGAAAIARLIRMRSYADDVAVVLEEFFDNTPDGWRHSHCDEVIGQYQAKAKQAAENGKKGGRPRKAAASDPGPSSPPAGSDSHKPASPGTTSPVNSDNPEITQPVNSANPEETGSKTNHEPVTNNQEQDQTPCAPPAHAADPKADLFDRFWKLYPNKKKKSDARKAWAKLKVTDDLFDRIVAGLDQYCASPDWTKDGGQFIPHPTTWLNGKRWEDEIAPPSTNVHKFPGQSRHSGFDERDYTAGLTEREDGTYAF